MRLLSLALAVFLFASGCSSTRPSAPSSATPPAEQPALRAWAADAPSRPARPSKSKKEAPSAVELQLRDAAARWEGTPYRYGGTTREGIDCSAFVQTVYQETFGLALPRVTIQQVETGKPVPRKQFQPGDLVFFRPYGGKGRHVGIYLSQGEFVHASSSAGVTISRIEDAYWREAYWTARRLLPKSRPLPSRPPEPLARPTTRSGW